MRNILLITGSILLFALAAAAQSPRVVPCIVDVGTADADGKHVAEWKAREAVRGVFSIAPGEQVVMPFTMPVDGECEARFAAFDGREEMAVNVEDPATGKTAKTRPAGEIQIMVLDQSGLDARGRNEKFKSRFTQPSAQNGGFSVRLPAGDYFFVISNHDQKSIPEKVFFWLGHTDVVDIDEK